MSVPPRECDVYERILAQHQAMRELLARIGSALTQRQASIEDIGDMLGQLGDQLVKHFTLEESEGYLGDALTHAPRLLRHANELLAQHPKMATNAQQLIVVEADGQDSQDWWEVTQKRFAAFVKELLEHERLEDGLLQEAYTRDIEASD